MSFFRKLKDRLTKSSSKIDEGVEAILETGPETGDPAPAEDIAPLPPAPWTASIDATRFGPDCVDTRSNDYIKLANLSEDWWVDLGVKRTVCFARLCQAFFPLSISLCKILVFFQPLPQRL
ncbi:MAG: hypothetical protein AAF360_06715, partial [Pseudomonadota bacterium]